MANRGIVGVVLAVGPGSPATSTAPVVALGTLGFGATDGDTAATFAIVVLGTTVVGSDGSVALGRSVTSAMVKAVSVGSVMLIVTSADSERVVSPHDDTTTADIRAAVIADPMRLDDWR